MRQAEVGQHHLTTQVDGHDPVKIGHVDGGERAVSAGNPGVAYQDVYPAHLGKGEVHQPGQRIVIAHVANVARLAEVSRGAGGIACVLAGYDDPRAGIDHRLGNAPADPAGGPGDDGPLACQ